ncbi:hypothetical protein [Streptomyces sp. NPDC047042]|uniref:hypothetical protein n=1 Tax=Streptomyces sp. NPDC047042 TaxID=3154807 RepID=UPI0033DD59B5
MAGTSFRASAQAMPDVPSATWPDGEGGAIANVALGAAVVADVPEHLLGRAMAGLQVLMAAAGVAGALAGGALGDRVGVRPALWLLALVMLTATALAAPPALRAARRQATPVAAPDETLDPA